MLKTRSWLYRILEAALLFPVFIEAPLNAQSPLACNVLSVPTQVRAEGFTELVGDIVLTCSGACPLRPANRFLRRISRFT